MKCDRCDRDEESVAREFGPEARFTWNNVWCPGSLHPRTLLCTLCWGDLQTWLKPSPKKLHKALACTVPKGHNVVSAQGVGGDFPRPMGVPDE